MFSNDEPARESIGQASVYERVLGDDFAALHPRLRTYFGSIPDGFEGVGAGSYRSAGLRVRALRPVFTVLGWWRIAFAEFGEDVPFTVRNVARTDGELSAARTFAFANATRTMRDVMRADGGGIVDRLGAGGFLEVELALEVSAGRLRMESGRLALRLWRLRVPLPRIVRVSLVEEALPSGVQHVDVRMRAPLLGEIYGYTGTFTYEVRRDTVAIS